MTKSAVAIEGPAEKRRAAAPRSRKTSPTVTDKTFLLNRAMLGALKEQIERQFPKGWTGRILDVGCGSKPYAALFDGRCAEYVGCDEYPVGPNIVQCPADRLSFEDNEFDCVFCSQVLEHVARPWAVMSECCRVLRPGGIALVTVPFLFPHHPSPTDYYRFTHEGLSFLAMQAGLEVEDMSAQCGSLATVFLLSNWYVGLVGHVLARRWLTKPLSWFCNYSLLVPMNVAGIVADKVAYARDYRRTNMGVANYMMIARKPLA